ncbi:MAG: MotA/TolQ/ExbB proton channel family protein [Candidatus Babeliales bacterium]|nr:MotA/TolQ/ExbB proton channel family protein [Candidatus Babeliales bacterium]
MKVLGNSMWQLIMYSDYMTWIVLLILFVLSVICWAILFYKVIIWRMKIQQLKNTILHMNEAKDIEDVIKIASHNKNNISGYFLTQELNSLKNLLKTNMQKSELTEKQWEFLQYKTDSLIDEMVYHEESYLSIAFITASVSTLLGLYGTIWGLIQAFMEISKKQSADITTVAPGIAEALITTLAGLMVAIPALAIYYYLKHRVVSIEQLLLQLSTKFFDTVQRFFTQEVE